MTLLPQGVKVHFAFGFFDMPKGVDGLAMLSRACCGKTPSRARVRVPRPQGQSPRDRLLLCLFTKRLEHGVFLWPSNVEPGGTLMLTSAQLSMLIDGVDWRAPERQWRPAVAG